MSHFFFALAFFLRSMRSHAFSRLLAPSRAFSRPLALNISQFYPRPGTPAARMKRVPTHVVKERTRELTALFRSYTTLDHLAGRTLDVLVTGVSFIFTVLRRVHILD